MSKYFLLENYKQNADKSKYNNIVKKPIVKSIIRLLAYKNEIKASFYPKFKKIPQKRGIITDETGRMLQYRYKLYRRH